jgi:nucleoside diphosphate kinase
MAIESANSLSRVPDKLDLYSVDPYFRDTWEDLVGFAGGSRGAADLMWDAAPLVIRPDGLQAGRSKRLIDAVADHGLRPVAALAFTFSRHVIRETWRYQLNIAHRDRIDVMDLLLQDEQGLYVMLERQETDPALPATAVLNEIKGATPPEKRLPGQLRTIAGTTQVSVVTYVHASDEPADVVREMGVFLDRDDRLRLFSSLGRSYDASAQVLALCDELHQGRAADFALPPALSRLRTALEGTVGSTSGELAGMLADMDSGAVIDWRRALALIREAGVDISREDAVAIAGHFCQGHLEGQAVIPDSGLEAWRVMARHA